MKSGSLRFSYLHTRRDSHISLSLLVFAEGGDMGFAFGQLNVQSSNFAISIAPWFWASYSASLS